MKRRAVCVPNLNIYYLRGGRNKVFLSVQKQNQNTLYLSGEFAITPGIGVVPIYGYSKVFCFLLQVHYSVPHLLLKLPVQKRKPMNCGAFHLKMGGEV